MREAAKFIFLIALISSGVYSDVKTSQIVHFKLACEFKTSLVADTVKASAYKVGDPGSIPRSGRSPGEGNGNPLQCSCLENPMDGGAW